MNNDDIRSVDVQAIQSTYNTSSSSIYMNINFNNAGSRKFRDITRDYQNTVTNDTAEENIVGETNSTYNETATNETTENSEEATNETSENATTNETSNEVADETAESEEETDNTIEIGLYIDGTSMMTTSFDTVIDNGVMSLSLGSASSDDSERILVYQAESLASILENDAMPVQYSVTGNVYISSPIEQNTIFILIGIGICIALIMFIVAIVKYRVNGVILTVCSIGFIALYLLILRYANVTISLEGIFAIALVFVINYIFCIMILNRLQKM